MNTMTLAIRYPMATYRWQALLSQAHTGSVTQIQQLKNVNTESPKHEQWKDKIDEEWQGHLDTLQRYVCDLLIKNRQLRMTLMAGTASREGNEHDGSVFGH